MSPRGASSNTHYNFTPRDRSRSKLPPVSQQREYCKKFLAVYRLRINQNVSREMAGAHASIIAGMEFPLPDVEREECEAWLRDKVKTIWRSLR